MGKMRFLVINVLNDCYIYMCLIVCIYVGMSGRIPFKGGGGGGGGGGENVKPGKNVFFFLFSENERISNSYLERYRKNPRSFSRPQMTKRITPLESSREI